MADKDQAVREFVGRLTACQPRLYAYIMTLVLDSHQADDVL
jgi:DNA-directed RNA polymerase specialized sigma24 family protein